MSTSVRQLLKISRDQMCSYTWFLNTITYLMASAFNTGNSFTETKTKHSPFDTRHWYVKHNYLEEMCIQLVDSQKKELDGIDHISAAGSILPRIEKGHGAA